RLIFELLTVGLVTLQEFAALELLGRSLRGDIVETDRHDDAERRIGKIEMGRRGKRLRLLEQEERHPAEIRIGSHNARSRKHPPAAVHGQLVFHDADLAAGSGRREVTFIVLEIGADLALPLRQRGKPRGRPSRAAARWAPAEARAATARQMPSDFSMLAEGRLAERLPFPRIYGK